MEVFPQPWRSSLRFTSPQHLNMKNTVAIYAGILSLCAHNYISAGEVNLNDLKERLGEGEKKKSEYGPYVGAFGGNTQGQSANVTIGGAPFKLQETDGSMLMGIEVGYSWKSKKLPVEFGLEFEGSYMSSEMNGVIEDDFVGSMMDETGVATDAVLGDDSVVAYHTDMNAVMFLLNGSITLDLRRYRARLGRWVTGFRPYFGGGIGGAQLWFRNTVTSTKNPDSVASVAPFSVDEFVLAYQMFGGIEYAVNERVAFYAEYRTTTLESFGEVMDFETSSWIGGIRIRYDKTKEREE